MRMFPLLAPSHSTMASQLNNSFLWQSRSDRPPFNTNTNLCGLALVYPKCFSSSDSMKCDVDHMSPAFHTYRYPALPVKIIST